jgi:hypothetical protein
MVYSMRGKKGIWLPKKDTKIYEIEFPGGRSDEYTVNVISQKMFTQCDNDCRWYNLMEGIIDHNTDGHVIDRAAMYIKHGSNTQVRKTTKGWHLCVEWNYGTTSWERLVNLKEINPVEVDVQLPITFLMPLIVCGGPHMYSRSASGLLLL